MKLLLVSYYFPPHKGIGGKRIARWARHLPRFGISPLVLTTPEPPDSLRDPKPPSVGEAQVLREYCPAWAFRAFHGTNSSVASATATARHEPSEASLWSRGLAHVGDVLWENYPVDPNVWFVPFASRAALRIAQREHVGAALVTAAPYSSFLVGLRLGKAGIPWIADFRDPWSFNFEQEKRSPRARRLDERLERAVVESAARVLFANDNTRKRYEEIYPSLKGRAETLYSGFDPAPMPGPAPWPGEKRPKFALVHFGDFYGPRKLGAVLDALAVLAREGVSPRELGILLLGKALAEDLARAEALGVRGFLHVQPARPYEEGMAILAGADALLYCDPGRERYFIAGKLFDYLRARRPIVGLSASDETRRLIEGHGVGRVFDPDDIAGLASGLRALLGGTSGYQPQGVASLSEDASARRLAEIARELVASRP